MTELRNLNDRPIILTQYSITCADIKEYKQLEWLLCKYIIVYEHKGGNPEAPIYIREKDLPKACEMISKLEPITYRDKFTITKEEVELKDTVEYSIIKDLEKAERKRKREEMRKATLKQTEGATIK